MTSTGELEFSGKYNAALARRYFDKHQRSPGARLNTWCEVAMARRALRLAGRPRSVLDLPCGTGRFWELLAEEPERKIYAADLNPPMFETGLQLRPPELTRRIEVFQSSAFAIPKPDNFVECVFCIRLLHHLAGREDRLRLLREFRRVTASTVVISLWIDGNWRAMLRARRERRPGRTGDCHLIRREVIEQEFAECGFSVVGRVHFLKYYSMWAAYVLRK